MKNVLVMGGSRGIGLETVKTLLQKGYHVTLFSRGASKVNLTNPNLRLLAGDALNEADVNSAIEANDAVVQTLGVPANLRLITGPISLFSSATKILITAMENKNTRRLLTVTGFGAGDSYQAINCLQSLPFNIVFGNAYRDKSIQEGLIKNSKLDWTLIRPGILTNQRFKSSCRVRLNPSEWRNGIVSRAAVADFIASAIDDPEMIGAEPVLSN
ncbi:MAG: epimerase [Rhodospirillaceae bacterium]|nr:epimerase [Rhodospirillaceae bacterium]|tara:strand:- start:266 stop:907 length:642 start_codon:yes stop_codon:yes gene_type:complete